MLATSEFTERITALLIKSYPWLQAPIERGDFKIAIDDGDGNHAKLSIRWPNTAIFRPSLDLINHVVALVTPDCPHDCIFVRSSSLVGIELEFARPK